MIFSQSYNWGKTTFGQVKALFKIYMVFGYIVKSDLEK